MSTVIDFEQWKSFTFCCLFRQGGSLLEVWLLKATFGFIQCLLKTALIVVAFLSLLEEEVLNNWKIQDASTFSIPRMFLLYASGNFVVLNWDTKGNMAIQERGKIKKDICGYFGFSDYNVNLFETNFTIYNKRIYSAERLETHEPPFSVALDSTVVDIGDFIWLIGKSF